METTLINTKIMPLHFMIIMRPCEHMGRVLPGDLEGTYASEGPWSWSFVGFTYICLKTWSIFERIRSLKTALDHIIINLGSTIRQTYIRISLYQIFPVYFGKSYLNSLSLYLLPILVDPLYMIVAKIKIYRHVKHFI